MRSTNKRQPLLVLSIVFSFMAALFLTVLPLPIWAAWFRPEWVLLALLFWTHRAGEWIGVGTAFVLGLCLDCMYGSVLGVHSFALVMVVYALNLFQRTMRIQGILIQMLVIFMMGVGYQCCLLLVNLVLKQQVPHFWAYWAPALVTCLLWPWLCLLFPNREGRHG